MQNRNTARTGFVGLLGLVTAVTIGLHALGSDPAFSVDWENPLAWLDASDPTDAIAALTRYVGLGVGYWVLLTTILYSAVAMVRRGRRPRWLTLVTLPPIRRAIDRTLAASLAISIAAAPVASLRADEPPPTPPPVVFEVPSDGIPVPHVGVSDRDPGDGEETPPPAQTGSVERNPVPVPDPAPEPPTVGLRLEPVVDPPVVVSATTTNADAESAVAYTVERGDNLWSISASHLAGVVRDNPSLAEVDDYWRNVVAANRDTLRSGDPNLIYPGEIITLPAPGLSR
jgi:hypothetical protein